MKCPKCDGNPVILEDGDGKYCLCQTCLHEYPLNEHEEKTQEQVAKEALNHFYQEFLKCQENLPPDFAKIINEHFWELIGD